MSKLLMLYGVAGSGKSTWAKKFCLENKYMRICPDDIREEVGTSISDMSNEYMVWMIAEERLTHCLATDIDVVFDATNVKAKNRRMPLFIAGEFGADVSFAIFSCDKEEAKRRIHKDIKEKVNRSNVPDDVVDAMYNSYLENIEEAKKYKHIIIENEK